jgi:hypothetical protein
VAALAASIAVVAVGVVVLASGSQASRPATHPADVYAQLAQQLKAQLKPLVPVATAKAPNVQIPRDLQAPLNGYSCAVATTNGCSLHPCVKYVLVETYGAVPAVSSATTPSCRGAAQAVPRTIPINAP